MMTLTSRRLLIIASLLTLAISRSATVSAQTPASTLVSQGTQALKDENYEKAIADFSEAIRQAPADADAWSERGEAYAGSGNFTQALSDCNHAIQLAPASSEVYRRRGNVYFRRTEYQRAITDYNLALKIDPRESAAYVDRGEAYYQLGHYAQAIDDYNQALRLTPKNSEIYALRGNARLANGDFDQGWDDYNYALELDPKNAYAYLCRGAAAAQRGAYDQAIADYDEAIRLHPNYQSAYRYRQRAERRKSLLRWGEISEIVLCILIAGLLFGAYRSYRSRSALGHTVDQYFERTDDARLIFHAGLRLGSYIVPDAHKEQALRAHARRRSAISLIAGFLLLAISASLLPVTFPLLLWLQASTGLSLGTSIPIFSLLEMTVLGLIFYSFLAYRTRLATTGLVRAGRQTRRPSRRDWLDALFSDTPFAARWIVLVFILFSGFLAIRSFWLTRDDFSLTAVSRMTLLNAMETAMPFLGLSFYAWILFRLWPFLYRTNAESLTDGPVK